MQRLGEQALERIAPMQRVLPWLLIGCAIVSAASSLSSVLQIGLLERMQTGDFTQAEADSNDLRETAVGVLSLLLYLATAITWCVWFRRSHAFVKILDRPMEFGPNAWGYFFVPFLNFYKPYQAVKELWLRATHDGAVPGVLPLWWGAWLVSAMVGNAVLRSGLKDTEGIPALIRLSYLEAFDGLTGVASAIAAYFVIRAFARVLRLDALR